MLSAFASCIFLLYLSSIPSLYFDKLSISEPYLWIIIVIGAAISLMLGIGFCRFLLRAFPLRVNCTHRNGVIIMGILSSVIWIGIWSLIFAAVPSLTHQNQEMLSLLRRGQETFWFMSESFPVRFGGFLATIIWSLGAFAPFLGRHLVPRNVLRQPFILYLRRFSSFADRAVVSSLLKCCPPGKPIAFLTPTISSTKDWNPFRIGLAGMKLWRPFRSMPIDLRATDENWQQAAMDLISKAEIVILDASTSSNAIKTEIEMVKNGGFLKKTVMLITENRGQKDELGVLKFADDGANIIQYRRSWKRAMPRMLWGLPAAFLVAFPIAAFMLVFFLFIIDQDLNQAGVQEIVNKEFWKFFVPVLVLFCWIYYVLFFRPAMDKDGSKKLRKHLAN